MVAALAAFAACATEDQRYQENRTRAHLTPRAKAALSPTDVDQIARLVAHVSRKRVLAIARATKQAHPDAYHVTIGLPWSPHRWDYGFLVLAREKGSWRIIDRADDLSVSLVGLGFHDQAD